MGSTGVVVRALVVIWHIVALISLTAWLVLLLAGPAFATAALQSPYRWLLVPWLLPGLVVMGYVLGLIMVEAFEIDDRRGPRT